MTIEQKSTLKFAKLTNNTGFETTQHEFVVNPYTNGFVKNTNEQDLFHSLTMETIQLRGVEGYYIFRESPNDDLIFGEDPTNYFERSYPIAMYLDSFESYEGARDMYTKFGFNVSDEIRLIVNPQLFKHQVNDELRTPREGDLIYFPLTKALFEITWVESEDPFHPLGTLLQQKISATKFVYSQEKMEITEMEGFGDIGDVGEVPAWVVDNVNSINGKVDIENPAYQQSDVIQDNGDVIIDSTEANPFGAHF